MGGIADLPQCGGINQMDIPLNKQGESGFVAFCVSLEQRDVFGVRHLPNYVCRTRIVTGFLQSPKLDGEDILSDRNERQDAKPDPSPVKSGPISPLPPHPPSSLPKMGFGLKTNQIESIYAFSAQRTKTNSLDCRHCRLPNAFVFLRDAESKPFPTSG